LAFPDPIEALLSMNCGRVCNQLSAYIDRELTGAEMMLVRQHLGDCEACQSEYDALCRMKMLLGRLATPAPQPDFVAATLRRSQRPSVPPPFMLSDRAAGVRLLWERWRHWSAAHSWLPALTRWQTPVGMAAACLAAVLILTSVFLHRPRHSDALVATSPVSVLEGQDPVSQPIAWEWASLESSQDQQHGPRIYSGRLPMNWVTASFSDGPYWSFP
jgi:anti-sigma factor RsiW